MRLIWICHGLEMLQLAAILIAGKERAGRGDNGRRAARAVWEERGRGRARW